MKYFCYDIKGIQRLIFSVPRLKAIVGGSCLIDEFDRLEFSIPSVEKIFAGGGKGTFACDDSRTKELEDCLKTEAHNRGLDIQFGEDSDIKTAAESADRLFPYVPGELTAFPCQVSGILPASAKGQTSKEIRQRLRAGKEDRFGWQLLADLRGSLPESIAGYEPVFFRNVKGEPGDSEGDDDIELDQLHANAASNSIGRRNRWAVIAMDGNDIGSQYTAFLDKSNEQLFRQWLKEMSDSLKQCTRNSFLAAIAEVLKLWLNDKPNIKDCSYDHNGVRKLVLPLRPLILGGDDVILLCHTKYAFQFVEILSEQFTKRSIEAAQRSRIKPLWPASGDSLTISAGVLFTNVHLPLHTAIPYAEQLLKNAKRKFRSKPNDNKATVSKSPTPAAIDFEVISDSLVDNPSDRRRRELIFLDEELESEEVCLTRRPYALSHYSKEEPTFSELKRLAEKLEALPKSIRSELLRALCKPWSERTTFMASLAKRHPKIFELLIEYPEPGNLGAGWIRDKDGKRRVTSVVDALLLLEEESRQLQETF